MKVGLVSTARFHFFDMARQLDQRQMLHRFVTGYPAWKTKDDGLACLAHYSFWQTAYAALLRTPFAGSRLAGEIEWLGNDLIDRRAIRLLKGCDAVIAQACAGLHVGRAVRSRGGIHFCDRGAAHIGYQDRLLRAEYERLGLPYHPIDPRKREKEALEYAESDGILVPSEFVRCSFVAEGVDERKVHKLQLGVDLSRYRPTSSPPASPFRILFVGALNVQKGTHTLLEAAALLKTNEIELTFAGVDTPETEPLFTRFDSGGQTVRLGHVPQSELIDRMSQSHLLVLPSVQDGFGMVVAQAMACGVPCIVSDHAGAAEIVREGETGFVFPARNSERLAELIDLAASDPERRQAMGQAALASVQQIGGWEQYGDRLAELLTNAIQARA